MRLITVAIVAVLGAGLASCADTPTTSPDPTPRPVATSATTETASTELNYPVVDTGQTTFYGNRDSIADPADGTGLSTQDAAYGDNPPSYTDNGDGTITDNVTGLMWAQAPVTNVTFDEAQAGAESYSLAGYDDWRLPTIKELYSLIVFTGIDPSGCDETGLDCGAAVPFIDTDYFNFAYGDASAGERMIDAQYVSSTTYVGNGVGAMAFGVNFADGRIKGYGLSIQGRDKTFEALYVRGATGYGENELVDNENGTISDLASGLTWTQHDSGEPVEWEAALDYCAGLDVAESSDWRLPNVKELQSIVDYTRSPSSTGSAAISPLFDITEITDEGGQPDFPFLWSSTTHVNLGGGGNAAYIAFGEALGFLQTPSGEHTLVDVHGAGAQRSDPKTGDASAYPFGHGPQGDVIRIDNYALCVTG